MGQTTMGILFGVRCPEGVELTDDNYDAPIEHRGLLDRWEEASGHCAVPDYEWSDGEQPLFGFWVAAGASGKDGVPNLDTAVALDDVATTEPYAAALLVARQQWETFAGWATGQGVELPKPRLWLTETEVS